MKPKLLTFRPRHLLLSILLLATLIFIAMYVRDGFVRPFLGDVLAVIWVYATLNTVLAISVTRGALIALSIACALECAQYFHLVNHLGLEHVTLARVILGATFDPLDLLAYTIGAALVLAMDVIVSRRSLVRDVDVAHTTRQGSEE